MKKEYENPFITILEFVGDVITFSVQDGTLGGEGTIPDNGNVDEIVPL